MPLGTFDSLSLPADHAFAQARSLPRVTPTADVEKMRRTAQEFEAVFLGQMLQPMFESIEVAEPFGGGNAEKMWRSMQVEEFGKALSRRGGVGIAPVVFRQLLAAQEAASMAAQQMQAGMTAQQMQEGR